MEMERVFAGIIIVEHDVDDVVFLEDESVAVFSVDGGILGFFAGREGGVEGWDFGHAVGD